MSKILRRKWANIWSEIFSPTIFKLDIIDGFKYRKKQTWLSLFATLVLFSLIGWLFSIDVANRNWSSDRIVLLALLYLPLLITLLFCFRACSIYDLTVLKTTEEKWFFTKKQARASLIFKVSVVSFGLYYCYWIYRLWQFGH
jgi:hypothetical protein